MAEGNSGGIMDGGPGMTRPPQAKEHYSRTPSVAEKVGDKLREGWHKLKNNATKLNRDFRERHGLPNDFAPDGTPLTSVPKVAGRPAGEFSRPQPSVATVLDFELLPKSEGTPEQRQAAKERHPASNNKAEVYDREKDMDRTLPEGVARLKPKE